MKCLSVLCCLIVAGCAETPPPPPTPFKGPGGGQGYVMKCSGQGRSLAACLKQASRICPRGHRVVDPAPAAERTSASTGARAASRPSIAIICK